MNEPRLVRVPTRYNQGSRPASVSTIVATALDAASFEELQRLADRRETTAARLIRAWVTERLQELRGDLPF